MAAIAMSEGGLNTTNIAGCIVIQVEYERRLLSETLSGRDSFVIVPVVFFRRHTQA